MSRISKPKRMSISPENIVNVPMDNERILLASLSSLFPEGEAFFVRAVRSFRSSLPKEHSLQEDISRFIGQEAFHSLAHAEINTLLYGKGTYCPDWVAKPFLNKLSIVSPRLSLHVTAILEHWTATLAKDVLNNTYDMTIAEQALWHTHAVEEIEHRHVSYELLCLTGNKLTPLWSKLLFPIVSIVFLLTTAFLYVQNGGTFDMKLLKKLSHNTPELVKYMLPNYIP